jgi:hypothetical protein
MWCWKKMEGIIWTGLERNAEIIKSKGGENWPKKGKVLLLVKSCMGTAF